MSFGIYAAGYAILICGLVYAAHLMHTYRRTGLPRERLSFSASEFCRQSKPRVRRPRKLAGMPKAARMFNSIE